MDWANERYVRLYTRDTATWKLLPWQGKVVLTLLMRKADRAGVVDLPAGDGEAETVAVLIDLPAEVVEPGLAALVKRGVLERGEGGIVFPNFIEAQEARASDAQRQREFRARRRDRARANGERSVRRVYFIQAEGSLSVKIGVTTDLERRISDLQCGSADRLTLIAVSDEFEESEVHDRFSADRIRGEWFSPSAEMAAWLDSVTECHAPLRLAVPSRTEPSQTNQIKKSASADRARLLWDEYNEKRSALPGARTLRYTKKVAASLKARLSEFSPEEVSMVLGHYVGEAKRTGTAKHCNSTTPLRPENFERTLAFAHEAEAAKKSRELERRWQAEDAKHTPDGSTVIPFLRNPPEESQGEAEHGQERPSPEQVEQILGDLTKRFTR